LSLLWSPEQAGSYGLPVCCGGYTGPNGNHDLAGDFLFLTIINTSFIRQNMLHLHPISIDGSEMLQLFLDIWPVTPLRYIIIIHSNYAFLKYENEQ
jgi:hypothetical protein